MKIEGFGGIKFWLRRCAEEHSTKAISHIKDADILFYQFDNFNKMMPEVQAKIISNLVHNMKRFGWEEQVREYDLLGESK
jgi:hypothetical protein